MGITALRKLINTYTQYSQLKKNVLSGTVYSAANAIITLLSYPIYLKYLGVEKYGLWSIVSVVFAFGQFGQIGTDTAITKYVANEYGHMNYRGITEYISSSFYILSIPSLIVICLLFLFKSQIADFIKLNEVFWDDGVRLVFFIGLLSVFSFFVNSLKGVIVGIGRMDVANYIITMARILQVITSVILLISGLGVWSLYYGFLMYYLAPSIIWFFILRNFYKIKIFEFRAVNKQKMRELLKYGGTILTGMIARMFIAPFNKIIIGRYIGLSEVAYYQIALSVVTSVRSLSVKGLESILPKFSELYGKQSDSLKDIFYIHKKGMKFIFAFVFPLLMTIFIFAEPILKIWLGNAFNMQIATALKILLIGWLTNALTVPDYYMFLGIGKVSYGVSATFINGISNVVLVLILLILSVNMSLNKVVVIESLSLAIAVIYLKSKFIEFKKLSMAVQK